MSVVTRHVRRARVRGPKFQIFRASNPELRTSDRAFLAHLALPRYGLRPPADLFIILLMFQFVSHSAQQMRDAKGLLEGLPCPEEFRDIQDILFLSGA